MQTLIAGLLSLALGPSVLPLPEAMADAPPPPSPARPSNKPAPPPPPAPAEEVPAPEVAPVPEPAPGAAPATASPIAEPPPPSRKVTLGTPPPKRGEPAGAHRHDGFYFRLASGFGLYREALRSESSDDYGGRVFGDTTGLATVGELAFGGTIARGLVLGGGLYNTSLVTSSFHLDPQSDAAPASELDPGRRSILLIAAFVDWYPRPRNGFHLQGALGVAGLSAAGAAPRKDAYQAGGIGLSLGAGYEWWVGDEWSLGLLGRVTAIGLSGKDDAEVEFRHAVSTSPALLLTLTYH